MLAEQGVVLIANGAAKFGAMALNLALSIKANDPFAQIALIYTDSAVAPLQGTEWSNQCYRKWFDALIPCPDALLKWNGETNYYLWPRLFVYELSPFKRTLYLDADTIVFRGKRLGQLLDRVKDREYAIQYSKRHEIDKEGAWWISCADVLQAYGRCSDYLYEINGFVSYFERSEENEAFARLTREVAGNMRIPCLSYHGAIGDETVQIIAAFIMDRQPNGPPFSPILWQGLLNKGASFGDAEYFAYTFTHSDPEESAALYSELTTEYAAPRGIDVDASLFNAPKAKPFGQHILFPPVAIPNSPPREVEEVVKPALNYPRNVHQIWINFEGNNSLPEQHIPFINSWISRSGLQHHLYSHDNLRELLGDHFPQFLDFYDCATYETERADICRYLLLYLFGGIYADADMECIKPMDTLLDRLSLPVCMALEPPAHRFWGRRFVGSAFVASIPELDIWLELVDFMRFHYRSNSYPAVTTGPIIVDYFLQEANYKEQIEILGSQYVYPLDVNTYDKRMKPTRSAFIIGPAPRAGFLAWRLS